MFGALQLGLGLTHRQGGGAPMMSPADLLALGTNGFWHGGDVTKLFQGTDESTPANDAGEVIGRSTDRGPFARNITQSSTSPKPKTQFDGSKVVMRFDGSDDNLRSAISMATAGAYIVKGKFSTASRVIIGVGNSVSDRGYLSVGAGGLLSGGMGNQGLDVIIGGSDIRNILGVYSITWDGSTVKLYNGATQIYSGAQSGAAGAHTIAVGALGALGTATASFVGGDIYHAVYVGGYVPTAADMIGITNYLNAN